MLFASDKLDSESGTFEFAMVPAGTYRIRIIAQNEQGHASWTQQTIHVEADVTGLHLALPASTSIKVIVRAEFPDKRQAGNCTTLNSQGKVADCHHVPAFASLRPACSPHCPPSP